jgi:hypothetical protein
MAVAERALAAVVILRDCMRAHSVGENPMIGCPPADDLDPTLARIDSQLDLIEARTTRLIARYA